MQGDRGRLVSRWWRDALRWIPVVLSCFAAGCVQIPGALQLAQNGALVDGCTSPPGPTAEGTGLDPAGFTLVSWNLHKGARDGWRRDLERLRAEADLLLIQESHLTPKMLRWLSASGLEWTMAHAFSYKGYWTGVLTGARVPQQAPCMQRTAEPWLRLPKTTLISYFPLKGVRARLLVVNLHGINFSFGASALAAQLAALEPVIAAHHGPVILAGDMNTWSLDRKRVLQALARRQGLRPVPFVEASRHLGRRVDHVYYRGLRLHRFRVERVTSSDHHPLIATFGYSRS